MHFAILKSIHVFVPLYNTSYSMCQHFYTVCFWLGEGIRKKSTLCTLVKRLKIVATLSGDSFPDFIHPAAYIYSNICSLMLFVRPFYLNESLFRTSSGFNTLLLTPTLVNSFRPFPVILWVYPCPLRSYLFSSILVWYLFVFLVHCP